MIESIENIVNALPVWLNAIFMLVTAASAIAALTPTKRDDRVISKVLNVIKRVAAILAIDVGHAKPKDLDDN